MRYIPTCTTSSTIPWGCFYCKNPNLLHQNQKASRFRKRIPSGAFSCQRHYCTTLTWNFHTSKWYIPTGCTSSTIPWGILFLRHLYEIKKYREVKILVFTKLITLSNITTPSQRDLSTHAGIKNNTRIYIKHPRKYWYLLLCLSFFRLYTLKITFTTINTQNQ